jgi:SNF2 family DNA or RNA helicase
MKYLKKLSKYSSSVGVGALLITGVTGCGGDNAPQQTQETQKEEKKAAFVVLEETKKGVYKVAEEFPAKETRIVLKKLDGNETVLTQEQLDKLIKEEAAKIDNGTSNLTKPDGAQVAQQNGGMSMGEAILASAAGAVVGSWIGNKLFGNPNYQQARQAGYKSPAVYNKSMSSFKNNRSPISRGTTSTTSTSKRSGFFGSKSGSSSGRFGG